MAKDPNKSGDGSEPNSLDEGFSDIERIGRRSGTRSAEDRWERQRIDMARSTIEGLEDLIESDPNSARVGSIAKGLSTARQTRNKLGPRIRLRAEARRDRAMEETRNAIEREYSRRAINGQVSDIAGTEAIQQRSLSMINMSPRELEVGRAGVMGQLGSLERESLNMVDEGLYDKEGRQNPAMMEQLRANYRKRGLLVQRLGTISAAETRKRHEGEDIRSEINSVRDAGANARQLLKRNAMDDEIKTSGLGPSELKSRETEAASRLVEALDKLNDAARKGAGNLEELHKSAKDAAEDYNNARYASANGGKGGGGASWSSHIGPLLGGVGQMAQEMGLNHPLQVLQNQAGFAGLSNEIYNSRKRALGGNMQDLAVMASGTFTNAQAAGSRASLISKGVLMAGAGAGVAQGVKGGAEMWGTGGLAGSGDLMSGISTAAIATSDLAQGATAGSYNLAFQQNNLALDRERSFVTGDMRQQLYNYAISSRRASLAGGRAGGKFFDQYAGAGADSMMLRMQAAGIGTEQFAGLAENGLAAQGGRFSGEQIFLARNLEKAGMGDMNSNIGRMSTLAAAGGNNPTSGLQSVMEAAFSKSLDSSKALNSMVDNTAAMVQQSVGNQRGIVDTTAASASILSGLVNPEIENKELAANRAGTAAGRVNAINSGVGRNFADMVGIASIVKAGGVGELGAVAIKRLDDPTVAALKQEMEAMKGMDPRERGNAETAFKMKMRRLGAGSFINQQTGEIDSNRLNAAFDMRSRAIFNRPEFTANISDQVPGYRDLKEGKLSYDEIEKNPKYSLLATKLGESAGMLGLDPREALGRGFASGINGGGKQAAADAAAGVPQSDAARTTDELATAQFKEMTKQARMAANELGGVAKALDAINQATRGLTAKLNESSADDFRGAASLAAKDFNNGARTFTTSVDKFGGIIDRLAGRSSISGSSVKDDRTAKRGGN